MSESMESESTLAETLESAANFVSVRRWYILWPTFIFALAAAGIALYLPSRYTSEATLVVVQQRVSSRYVEPATTGSAFDELNNITRELFSRSRMIAIINEFGLYSDGKRPAQAELFVDRLRKDADIQPLDYDPRRDLMAFKVSFTASTPRLAQDVTSRLTSLLIESNLKSRGSEVTTTARFLDEQLAEAKQKLEQQEQRIRDFKLSNAGGMPDQEQFNLTTIAELRVQLQTTAASLGRAQLQRISLESEINSALARLSSERASLLARYTAKYPEVIKKNEGIARLEALSARLANGTAQGATPSSHAAPATDDPTITRLQGQVEAYVIGTEALTKDQARLGAELSQAQARLRLTPFREQQLSSVLREYELHKQNYTDLLNKQMRAKMSASVEEQQEGQHFRIADPPTFPTAPSAPKRLRLSLGGIGAGLACGAVLALLAAMRDSSFHTEKELRRQFSVPIIVGVPLLRTPFEQKKHIQWNVLQWIAGFVMMLCVVVAELYVFRAG